ncbi:AAA family ATPase [Bacillus rhizoplanae]|uniref:AAA family ATPase n=1 Tax=Bacillus rhizoplanae TaxID=2880966 RepID=UPI003D223224
MKLEKALHPSFVKRLQHMRFVGKFVEEQKDRKGSFFVVCLSPIPNIIEAAFGERSYIFEGLYKNKQNEKFFASIKEGKREKQLLLFRLSYTGGALYVELIRAEEREIANSYKMIPSPKLSVPKEREVFERKLGKGYVSFLIPKFPHDFGTPELLWYEGRIYGNIFLKPSISAITYREQRGDVRYLDIDDWGQYAEMNVENSLFFVPTEVYEQLEKQVKEDGKQIEIIDIGKQEKGNEWNEREYSFLQYVKQCIAEKELYIDESDIYNFHVCVKTNLLTIVGGMPGIGKSQFVQTYAEALGLTFGKNFIWIPVSPSYQEPHDVLGYLHSNGTYMESETKLVRTLLDAAENPNQLYMIVFDEMNMSYIEHWFTPFLSLLQLDRKNRILSLYAAGNEKEQDIPSQIEIGDNIIFIGTVNFDETTKELSDRLLDRVNVVFLQKIPFCEMSMVEEKMLHLPFAFSVSASEFQMNWVHRKTMLDVFTDEELELLDKIHQLLFLHDTSKGISFRVASAIASYLNNIPCDECQSLLISREEAFDIQIKQRILTKLRGTEATIGALLREEGKKEMSLVQLLQSELANRVSTFEHSLMYMKQKRRELELYGYVK